MNDDLGIATADDAGEIVAVRLTSWRAAYDFIPAEHFDAIDVARVVERTGERMGRARRPHPRPAPRRSHRRLRGRRPVPRRRPARRRRGVRVYALPEQWSTGAGRVLFAAALAELATQITVLWVLEDNPRARRFYESAGLRVDGGRKTAQMLGGITRPEIRYRLG